MNGLEWLLLLELLLLTAAAICYLSAYTTSRNTPDDAFYQGFRAFWRVMLQRYVRFDSVGVRIRAEEADDDDDDGEEIEISEEAALAALAHEAEQERSTMDAAVAHGAQPARTGKGAGLMPNEVPVVTLNISVIANQTEESIIGLSSDGLEIGVLGVADDVIANKAVLDQIAKAFSLKAYQVTLGRGHFHAKKLVRIAGLNEQQLRKKLERYDHGAAPTME